MRYLLLFFVFTLSFSSLRAQNHASDQVNQLYQQAKELMVEGNYQEANVRFRKALSLKQKLPSDLCYFFAETLFQIQQFKNSENFVNKYFELTDQEGKYYQEAMGLKKKLSDRLEAIANCSLCNTKGYRFEACNFCNQEAQAQYQCPTCSGTGHLMCQVCIGEGILIEKNAQNENRYRNCEACQQKGYTPCPKCEGEKTLSGICSICQGKKQVASEVICTHQAIGVTPSPAP